MLNYIITLLFPIFFSVHFLLREARKWGFNREWFQVFLFFLSYIISAAFIYPNWLMNSVIGALTLTFTYIPLLIVAIGFYTEWKYPITEKIGNNVAILSMINVSIIVISIFISFYYPHASIEKTTENREMNVNKIKRSINNISNSLENVKSKIINQTDSVNATIAELITAIEEKNNELFEIKREVEYYKKLSSLSEGQAEVVKETLAGNKYLDIIISFLIGLGSSFAFYFINSKMIKKKHIITRLK